MWLSVSHLPFRRTRSVAFKARCGSHVFASGVPLLESSSITITGASEGDGQVAFFLVQVGAAVFGAGMFEGGVSEGEERVAFFLIKAGATVDFRIEGGTSGGGASGGGVSEGEERVTLFLVKAGATVDFRMEGGTSGGGASGGGMSEGEGRVVFFLVKVGAAVDLRGASEGGACGGEGQFAFFLVKVGATVVFGGGESGGGTSGQFDKRCLGGTLTDRNLVSMTGTLLSLATSPAVAATDLELILRINNPHGFPKTELGHRLPPIHPDFKLSTNSARENTVMRGLPKDKLIEGGLHGSMNRGVELV